MARLVAIGLLLWAVYTTVEFAIANAPTAAEAAIGREEAPSPLDAIAETVTEGPTTANLIPRGPSLAFGVYEVAESPDPKVAARDRDYRPRIKLFIEKDDDERVDDDDDDKNDRDGNDEDEVHVVQGQIMPGLYATSFDTEDCSYELWRVMRDRRSEIISEDYLASGRMLVTINGIEPDWFTSTEPCGEWYAWTPLPESLTEANNGDYWVGDLAHGVWDVPIPCRWEKVTGFRGANIHDVLDGARGPGTLTVDADTYGVRIRGCRHPMTLTAAAPGSIATL